MAYYKMKGDGTELIYYFAEILAIPVVGGIAGGYGTSHYLVQTPSYTAFAAGTVGGVIAGVMLAPTIVGMLNPPSPPPPHPHIEASKKGH
jgi:hypothetical protein